MLCEVNGMSILDRLCDGDAALKGNGADRRLYSVRDAEEMHAMESTRMDKEASLLLFSGLCLATMAFVVVAMTVWDSIRPAVR